MYEVWADRWAEGAGKGGGVRVGFVYKKCIYTKVGHPREGTRQTVREGLNVVWVKEPSAPNHYIVTNGNFANPVRAGCDQFLVQPHLKFCHAIELNLSQRP